MKKITEEEEGVWLEWLDKKLKERDDCYKRENMIAFLNDEVARNHYIKEMTKYYWCPELENNLGNLDCYIEEFKKIGMDKSAKRMEDAKGAEKRFIAMLSETRPLPFNKFSSFEEEFEEEMKNNKI